MDLLEYWVKLILDYHDTDRILSLATLLWPNQDIWELDCQLLRVSPDETWQKTKYHSMHH
jgi:hypothetical protein